MTITTEEKTTIINKLNSLLDIVAYCDEATYDEYHTLVTFAHKNIEGFSYDMKTGMWYIK